MPRSIPTMRLNQVAHALGDQYYRCVTRTAGSGTEPCIEIGQSYLEALEALRKHLDTLEFSDELETLILTTEGHIKLIRSDLERWARYR